MSETLGERVQRLRKERGFSVSALARRVGVSEGAVRGLESGVSKQANLETGLRLAVALQVSPSYLAWGREVMPTDGLPQSLEGEISFLRSQVADLAQGLADLNLRTARLASDPQAEKSARHRAGKQ